MLFSLLKHYLDIDTALISYGVENYFPRLWGTGISDAIFSILINVVMLLLNCHFNTLSLHKFCFSETLFSLLNYEFWTFTKLTLVNLKIS